MRARTKGSALYVYGIGRQDRFRRLFANGDVPPALELRAPVALVTQDDLAAVVSEVPLQVYGQGAFEEHLKDPVWAAGKLMCHERVAEFLASTSAVVPSRFGVLYSTPEKIRHMLASRHDELVRVLDELENRQEWGLNIYVDRKKLDKRLVELSPVLSEMKSRMKDSSPGKSYLLQKKMETLRVSEAKTESKRVVAAVRSALKAESVGMKELPIREIEAKAELAVAGKLSWLVDRKKLKAFRRAAEKLAKVYAPYGFKLELTGPWPPYNFSE